MMYLLGQVKSDEVALYELGEMFGFLELVLKIEMTSLSDPLISQPTTPSTSFHLKLFKPDRGQIRSEAC